MSVKVRPYRRGGWEVDVNVLLPDGSRRRERKRVPASSRSGALRWGELRERELVIRGVPKRRKEVPTLDGFAERFLDGYARANRQKPSGIAGKRRSSIPISSRSSVRRSWTRSPTRTCSD